MTGPHGKLPHGINWNVGNLHLVPNDPRDTSMDTPDRLAKRGVPLETLERLRDMPVFKCDGDADAVWEEFMILPVIYVRVKTSDREQAVKDILAHMVIHVGGMHVPGFDPKYSVGPNVEVV